MSHQSVL